MTFLLHVDSDEEESFVYRDYRSTSLYPTLPSQWIDHYSKRDTTDYSSTATETKPRRPVLRSAVSELPATAMLRSTFPAPTRKHSWYPASDADDTPLLPRYSSSKRKRRSSPRTSKRYLSPHLISFILLIEKDRSFLVLSPFGQYLA